MSVYIFLNPEAVKRANQSGRYREIGIKAFGSKPIWFFRLFGLLGIFSSIWLAISAFRISN
jgi:hypothetical protein